MQRIFDLYNFLVGVSISVNRDVLVVQDRRPSWALLGGFAGTVGVLVLVGWLWWADHLLDLGLLFLLLIGIAFLAFVYLLLTSPYREMYVFDRGRDNFIFTRGSLLRKSDMLEGSASQFDGVEVQRQKGDDGPDLYAVALSSGGMLLGQPSTQTLRERAPIINSSGTEIRIAEAIACHLNIRSLGVRDVSSVFHY